MDGDQHQCTVSATDWVDLVPEWVALGAVAVGGCCRVGPDGIARVRRQLVQGVLDKPLSVEKDLRKQDFKFIDFGDKK